jgi:hypothetical protein
VVSGVKVLKASGYHIVESNTSAIDYSLLKGLIEAMRWLYSRMALIMPALLTIAGMFYIHTLLKTYSGNHQEYISRGYFCALLIHFIFIPCIMTPC